jgi:hypothetical protein
MHFRCPGEGLPNLDDYLVFAIAPDRGLILNSAGKLDSRRNLLLDWRSGLGMRARVRQIHLQVN